MTKNTKVEVGTAVVGVDAARLYRSSAVTGAVLALANWRTGLSDGNTATVRWSSGVVTVERLSALVAVVDVYGLGPTA